MTTLVTAGVFDVLHRNHKIFISTLISKANADKVLILLVLDKAASIIKGVERPLYTYEWRKADLINFFNYHHPGIELGFKTINEEDNHCNVFNEYLGKKEYVVGLKEPFSFLRKNTNVDSSNLITIKEQPGEHTSSIPLLLHTGELLSQCSARKMAAVLTREGKIVSVGQNGVNKDALTRIHQEVNCGKCPVSRCNYKSAEEVVLYEALPGDDLFCSYSPNLNVAKMIIQMGINRVVFLEHSKDLEGYEYLILNKVKVRKAGLD